MLLTKEKETGGSSREFSDENSDKTLGSTGYVPRLFYQCHCQLAEVQTFIHDQDCAQLACVYLFFGRKAKNKTEDIQPVIDPWDQLYVYILSQRIEQLL